MSADQIVEILLEDEPIERVCMVCARQHGYRGDNHSHGYCKRHYLEFIQDSADFLGQEKAQQMLADAEARPPESFSPDMGPVLGESEFDLKSFMGRNYAKMAPRMTLLDVLKKHKINPETIDGVEVCGTRQEDGEESRCDAKDASRWYVMIHSSDPENWINDYGDYASPGAALAAGKELYRTLKHMHPDQTIQFVDEISVS